MGRPRNTIADVASGLLVGDDCWHWTGSRSNGYGRVSIGGKLALVHRVIYEWLVGPIPEGMTLDHLCRNRTCANPDHLEPVTRIENSLRCRRAVRTHCKRGHKMTPENTFTGGAGALYCGECLKLRGTGSKRT